MSRPDPCVCRNLYTQTDDKENSITFGYDSLNRIQTKSYTIISHPIGDPNYTEATPNVEYRYDGYGLSSCTNCIGQLTSVNNTSVVTIYDEYDEMGRVKNTTKTITDDQPRTTYTEYDLSGKITNITHLTNSVIDFVTHNTYYPGTGLLYYVTGAAVEYARITGYEPTGKIKRIYHDFNHTDTVYKYYSQSTRLEEIKTWSGSIVTESGSTPVQDKDYMYSGAGDIEVINDYFSDAYTYTYDNLHRLKSETSSDTAPPTSTETLIYAYNNPNHINAVSSISYNGTNYYFTYDNNGNMRQGWDFTNGSIASRNITWNADNMPVTISHSTKGTTTFTYDGDGVRAKKVAGGTTTYYIANDYEIKNGTHIKSIFAGNLRVAEIEGSTATIFHKDHLGSSIAMTRIIGANTEVVETTEYLPFGGMRNHTGTEVSDYKFTDQELDKSSNLYNYDARLYDPVIGRFISIDPVIPDMYDPQYLNPYTYCRNNPLIYTDPSGKIAIPLPCFFPPPPIVPTKPPEPPKMPDLREIAQDIKLKLILVNLIIKTFTFQGEKSEDAEESEDDGGSGNSTDNGNASNNTTSRQARRDAMRKNNTPTSRGSDSQTGSENDRQHVTEGSDGKPRVQTHHKADDENHPNNHWHDVEPKVDDSGDLLRNKHGQVRYKKSGSSSSDYNQ